MKFELNNQNIALIAPDMYDYPGELTRVLEQYGANVVYFRDRPQHVTTRFLRNVNKELHEKIRVAFFDQMLSELKKQKITIALVIKGTAVDAVFLDRLRKDHPGIRIVMYQWDINKKYPYLHLVDHVDSCYVFDETDTALHPKIKYLPLFYRDSYKSLRHSPEQKDIDLLHIGSLHEGKYRQVEALEKTFKASGINVYWYLVVAFSNWVKRMLMGEFYFKIKLRSLNNDQILALYRRSKAILDLPQSGQKGLTMRTFEVLGAYKKLVTTNPTILKEKIYTKELVYVIGSDSRSVADFLKAEVVMTPQIENNIESYSIHNWVKKLFE